MHAPVVVLGGGPGGYAAAFLAADEGLEVTIVGAEPRLGGTCLVGFRPDLVQNLRQGGIWRLRWHGTPEPRILRVSE